MICLALGEEEEEMWSKEGEKALGVEKEEEEENDDERKV